MKLMVGRGARPLLAVAIAVLGISSLLQAQDKKDFGGWYFGGHGGMNLAGHDVSGYNGDPNACFDPTTFAFLPSQCQVVVITQTSGINVQTRGIIIVPGTTRNIPATSTGGSVDFTVPTCATSATPPFYNCTGNRSLGTFSTGFSEQITSPGSRSKGFLGGGQIGYNKQFTHLVIGGEGEFSASTVTGTSQVFQVLPATALTNCVFGGNPGDPAPNPCTPTVTTYTREASSRWTSSLRVRAGWIWGRTLIYGTGGPAIASVAVKATDTFNPTLSNGADCPCPPHSGSAQRSTGIIGYTVFSTSQDSHVQLGWTAGIGVERSLWHRFRWGVEYRHFEFGNKTYPGTQPTAITVNPSRPVSVSDNTITDSSGRPFQAGGIFAPPTTVSYVDDRIAARFNFHF
jgi:opacity protein-like surface antigen